MQLIHVLGKNPQRVVNLVDKNKHKEEEFSEFVGIKEYVILKQPNTQASTRK
uniref:Uncharacterized protein n=1 Tax=Arion vulgaris TaxID=1028688 RepID=A0A0B7BC83_9EUPU